MPGQFAAKASNAGPKRSFGNNNSNNNNRGGPRSSFGNKGGAGGPPRGGAGGPPHGGFAKKGGFQGGRGGGMRPGAKVAVEPHKHAGIFVAHGKEDVLATKNMVPGFSVYGEKLIEIKLPTSVEYRAWNPFRSKIAAAIIGGIDELHIAPGKKVLYLGAASGTTVSHVSDIVGPEGRVYAVEFSKRVARDLLNLAQVRPNIVPIIADARKPSEYKMLVSMVDTIFSDVAQPDQSRIVAANAQLFLKNGGGIVISIKASCVDSTAAPEAIFASEVDFMKKNHIKPSEQITLEPYHRDHAVVIGKYRVALGKK